MCWSVSVFCLEKLWLRMQRYYNIITITSDNRSNPLWSGQILRAALCVHVCGFVGSRTYKGHGTSSVFNMYEKSFVWFLHQVACITYNSAAVENKCLINTVSDGIAKGKLVVPVPLSRVVPSPLVPVPIRPVVPSPVVPAPPSPVAQCPLVGWSHIQWWLQSGSPKCSFFL